ncbi:MAG: NAD-dependent epimerase/dehydratase family protein [Candidatus Hodarchaeales archaeon]
MAILITGGTGLVGTFLLEILAQDESIDGRDCHVIYRKADDENKIKEQGLTPVKADLTDSDSLKKALKDIEIIYNLASIADDWAGWDSLYQVNVLGMKNLLNAIIKANNDPFLAHISSTGVYGHFIPPTPIDENYQFNPTSIYQKSKFLQEKAIWDFSEENNWKNFGILRSPSVIGPRDTKTIYGIFKAVWERKFPILKGGKAYTTFIHPYDLSGALLLMGNKRNIAKSQAYNLKSFEVRIDEFLDFVVKTIKPPKPPKPMNYQLVYTVAVLSEIYAKITGKHTTLNRYRVTKFSNSRRYIDQKIQKDLGFKPTKDLETTVLESYEWLVKHNLFPPKGS